MLACDHVYFICKNWQMIYFSKQPLLCELYMYELLQAYAEFPEANVAFG